MIHWNKKKYARELKKGYWDLEPHFYYYCLMELFNLFKDFLENKMDIEDVKSALYGKFVSEGKPIKKGFYDNFNMTSKIVKEIYKTKKEVKSK